MSGGPGVARAKLRLIGYWRSEQEPEWPDPNDFVDQGWDEDLRHQLAWYFSHGQLAWVAFGSSPCRFCGKPNGSVEFTDGVLVWPEGLAHYIEDHGVRLPREIVEHGLARLAALHEVEVDREWWLAQRPDWTTDL